MPEGQIATLASTLEIPPSGKAFTHFKQSVWDHYAHAPHLALIDAALAGVAHADMIHRDHTVARICQNGDHLAVERYDQDGWP